MEYFKFLLTFTLLCTLISSLRATIVSQPAPHTLLNHTQWKKYVEQSQVVKIEPGCGRMQNRLLTFSDGTKACARYRYNSNLMQGEIYSYVLADFLDIGNLPALTVVLPDIKMPLWSRVSQEIVSAEWSMEKPVVITQFVPDVQEIHIHPSLKEAVLSSGSKKADGKTESLLQWSDMIIFDYLIGNMDRLVNSLHNKQWNANIWESSVHNLGQADGTLILFDNEDGLFHGYKIMNRFGNYHEQSLKLICTFRDSTVQSIKTLVEADVADLSSLFTTHLAEEEPIALKYLPRVKSSVYTTLLSRLQNVITHIVSCQH